MSEVKPALTPEEWAQLQLGTLSGLYHDFVIWDGREHRIAAVALQGQHFGFTWEDVDLLMVFARMVDHREAAPLCRLADRIAALLPPRENEK